MTNLAQKILQIPAPAVSAKLGQAKKVGKRLLQSVSDIHDIDSGIDPLVYEYNALSGGIVSEKIFEKYSTSVPQGGVLEMQLDRFEQIDWRAHFSARLSGTGVEIGALQRPLPVHERMKVKYVDRFTVEQLRVHYPELNDFPFVEPEYVCDAEQLETIGKASQDFLVATYVFEHLRCPLRALENWCRVVKPGGLVYFTVPDRRAGFDLPRVRTTIEHHILDYYSPSRERDKEHFLDYAIHVQKGYLLGAILEAERLEKMDYCIHYHVFIPSDVLAMINWFSENIRAVTLLEGPCMSPSDEEIHFLLRVEDDIIRDGSVLR